MAASERVHISNNPAGELQEDSLRSPSVVPMYHGYDGNLQTRYRQTPALAQETKPATTSTTPRSRRQTPLTDDEMWDETICDGGQAALALTRGSSQTEAIPDPVIFASMLLDPTKFTPDLAEWKKEHNRTMPRLMQAYSKHRPEISDAITALTNSSGYECRIQIDRVVQTMFAADRLHPAAAYCLMMLMWYDHPKSQKRDMISLIVEDYLLTPDDLMDDLIEASLNGSTLNIAMVGQGHLDRKGATCGLERLDPKLNGNFTQNWLELWACMVNALCYTTELHPLAELNSAQKAWCIEDINHILIAKRSETVKDVVARHVTAIRKLTMLVKKVGHPHTAPNVYLQGTNLLKAFAKREALLSEVQHQMKLKPPDPSGIDFSGAIEILTTAERAMDRPNHDQLAEVFELGKAKPPGKEKPNPRDKDKGAAGDRGPAGPAAEDPKDTFSYGANPSLDATHDQKTKAREDNACSNCLKKGHFAKNCNVRRRDGAPWKEGHVPHQLLEPVHPAVEPEQPQEPEITLPALAGPPPEPPRPSAPYIPDDPDIELIMMPAIEDPKCLSPLQSQPVDADEPLLIDPHLPASAEDLQMTEQMADADEEDPFLKVWTPDQLLYPIRGL